MTDESPSDRRCRANQANARLSTGPRSVAGKARSSRNALRHGLNVPIWRDPSLTPQVEEIAKRIAGRNDSEVRMERARRVAAAQLDLNRIRAIRRRLINDLLADEEYNPEIWRVKTGVMKKLFDSIIHDDFESDEDIDVGALSELEAAKVNAAFKLIERINSPPLPGKEKLGAVLEDKYRDLLRLDRYERGAFSRRGAAIRDLDDLSCA